MKATLITMLLACWSFLAEATQVREKPLKDLVAESDHILVATIAKIDMVDGEGNEISNPDARTGPFLTNTIRLHLTVHKDGILKTGSKPVPDKLVVALWQAWHFSLGQWNQEQGKEYIFLLKGDDYQRVYPADFFQKLSKRAEIEQLIREAHPKK